MPIGLTDSVPNRVDPRAASLGSAELTVEAWARAIGEYREGFGTPLVPQNARSDPPGLAWFSSVSESPAAGNRSVNI